MMVRSCAIAVLVIGLLLAPGSTADAAEVAVIDLIDDGGRYDGASVTVTGELVGDYGSRRDGTTWTQLNQDVYVTDPIADGGAPMGSNVGIAVRIPSDLLEDADAPGRYRQVGPVVTVTGTWRYHDPERQGESYLDVDTLAPAAPGRALSEPPDWWAMAGGAALLLAGGALLASRRRRRSGR